MLDKHSAAEVHAQALPDLLLTLKKMHMCLFVCVHVSAHACGSQASGVVHPALEIRSFVGLH